MMELRFAMRQYQSTAATTTEMTTTAIAQSPTGTQEATTKEHRKMSTISTAVPSARILYDFITPEDEVYLVHKIDTVGDSSSSSRWKNLNGRRSMYWGGTLTPSNALIRTPLPSFIDTVYPNIFERFDELDVFSSISKDDNEVKTADKGKGKSEEGKGAGAGGQGFNVCLVNEYLSNQGILAHTDGPAYSPLVLTLSLGNHTILRLVPAASLSTPSSPSSSSAAAISALASLSVDASSRTSIASTSSSNPTSRASSVGAIDILLPPRSVLILSQDLYSSYLHSIEAKSFDTMEELKACVNWESWWEDGAKGLEGSLVGEGDLAAAHSANERKPETVHEEEGINELSEGISETVYDTKSTPTPLLAQFNNLSQPIRELLARRRLVEEGSGWERARRISLTCRRVEKVRKGVLRF